MKSPVISRCGFINSAIAEGAQGKETRNAAQRYLLVNLKFSNSHIFMKPLTFYIFIIPPTLGKDKGFLIEYLLLKIED